MIISVIVPVYNGEKYVERCMQNLQRQTYKNLEIIAIDDGSTDRSNEYLQQYPIKIFKQENQGLSAARNAGMKIASGDYIHFFDVDDLISDNFYEKVVDAHRQIDADIYCTGMENEPKPHRTLLYDNVRVLSLKQEKIEITMVGRWGYVWRYVFRKSFLEARTLQFEVGVVVEDLPFSLQAVYFADKVVTVPQATYYYKENENTIMTSPDPVARLRRHKGWQRAKEFRRQFAREHKIKIPGVFTGRVTGWIDKWFA
ncbi:MAG: glycosyltransferase [Bacteroidales bacterium]|jgi:glycosyltransferase involved in cell wall biosynthesis|nr:glycosyltransferase [Bacteroidales bacterium]